MVTLYRKAAAQLTGRRVIYICILLAVTVPMIWRISFKEHASPMVRDVFDTVAGLPQDANVLVILDFDVGAVAEMEPMSHAFTRHLCLKGARLFYLTLWPTGPVMINRTVRDVVGPEFADYRYGVDYVNLGFASGNEGTIAVALTNFKKAFPTDTHNISSHNAERLPIMQPVDNLQDFDLIIDISAGFPGLEEWIQYAAVPGGIPLVGGSVAVGSPDLFPYVPEQLIGLLAGLKGAAEYEQLLLEAYPQLDRPECRAALERMGPQTVAHLVIAVFIIIGNLLHFLQKRRGEA